MSKITLNLFSTKKSCVFCLMLISIFLTTIYGFEGEEKTLEASGNFDNFEHNVDIKYDEPTRNFRRPTSKNNLQQNRKLTGYTWPILLNTIIYPIPYNQPIYNNEITSNSENDQPFMTKLSKLKVDLQSQKEQITEIKSVIKQHLKQDDLLILQNQNLENRIDELGSTLKSLKSQTNNNPSKQRPAELACQQIQAKTPPSVQHVIRGVKARQGQYPYMANIAYKNEKFVCGGTLISNRHVLTAAHCCYDSANPPIFVRLGMVDIDKPNKDSQIIDILDVSYYINYTSTTHYDDIGILILKKNAIFSKYVYPACLYTQLNVPAKTNYVVSGWGVSAKKDGKPSKILLSANLENMPLQKCHELWQENLSTYQIRFTKGIIEKLLCAYDPKNETDACTGDSGGPLVLTNDEKKTHYVVGIVSKGSFCVSNMPGIYTRVAAYLDYIESIVWNNTSDAFGIDLNN